ncbi:hypothetical protein QFC19_003699 [Naganishia cerealis]|uniref:Uncharacterized protein n=1 Tax=Naganishia cerealis TaxID=610337 RepID=A0ACC2W0D2_9TREE|nr:hypothetical protein QFC19_003699 [Naganishia cerealis]
METAHKEQRNREEYSSTALDSALPLFTPAIPRPGPQMIYNQQDIDFHTDPVFPHHPLGTRVSFTRANSTPTDSSFREELSSNARQVTSPNSKRNLFTSAAVYGAYLRSRDLAPSPHRPSTQPAEDLVRYRHSIHGMHYLDPPSPLRVIDSSPSAGPSGRRASYHYAWQQENAPAYAKIPAISRTYYSSTPQKGKVRRKQGPSVKKTEVGMACSFCRRRQVASTAAVQLASGSI